MGTNILMEHTASIFRIEVYVAPKRQYPLPDYTMQYDDAHDISSAKSPDILL
jgi:hypothetical protein